MRKRLITIFLCFFITMPIAMSQMRLGKKEAKLEKDCPAVYITFESFGTRDPIREGDSDNVVLLRLHNNLRWSLMVPGYLRFVSGFTNPVTLTPKVNPDEVVLYYEIEDTRMRRGRVLYREVPENESGGVPIDGPRIPQPPIGYRMTDLKKTISLAPGKSVLFSIPSEHLTKNLAVNISFHFEWEGNMDQTDHRVYFYGSDLTNKDDHNRKP